MVIIDICQYQGSGVLQKGELTDVQVYITSSKATQ